MRTTLIPVVLLLALALPMLPASDLLPGPEALLRHRDDLQLRDEQVQRIEALAQRSDARYRELQEAEAEARREFDAVLATVPLDAPAARTRGKRLLDAERAISDLRLQVLLDIHAVLDPAQRTRLITVVEDKRDARRQAEAQVQRIETMARRLAADGGDLEDIEARLAELQVLWKMEEHDRFRQLVATTIAELERRLEGR